MNPIEQFDDLAKVPASTRPLHLAIGMFDGLHLGHRAVVKTAVQSARESGGRSGVLTFCPHPSALFRPKNPTRLIMTEEAKAHALSGCGVDLLITQRFTPQFAAITAEDFLPTLKKHLPNLAAIYVGENWRFGKGRHGDVSQLVHDAQQNGLSVFSIPRVNFDGQAISSTRIRKLLQEGGIERVNALLGYAYFSEGRVTPGKGLGKRIGFPTLNLDWAPDLAPRLGVYAVTISSEGKAEGLPGVANFGLRPTVENAREPRLEVHVLGECPIVTGDEVRVEWRHFLRPEKKFADVTELRAQIALDREQAIQWFASE